MKSYLLLLIITEFMKLIGLINSDQSLSPNIQSCKAQWFMIYGLMNNISQLKLSLTLLAVTKHLMKIILLLSLIEELEHILMPMLQFHTIQVE
jgi:hypothetical protein